MIFCDAFDSNFLRPCSPIQRLVGILFVLQDISDDKCSFTSEKGSGLRGLPWKDFSKYGLNVGKANSSRSRMPEENISTNQVDKYEHGRSHVEGPQNFEIFLNIYIIILMFSNFSLQK